MKRIGTLMILALMLNGCTAATWELIYSDARVVYQDAKYVVHEIQEAKKQIRVGCLLKMMPCGLNVDINFKGQ